MEQTVSTRSSHMTDVQLRETYGDQLATGKPVIVNMYPASEGADGERYVHFFVAQEGNRTGQATTEDALLLGWQPAITRAHRNAKEDIIKSLGWREGTVIENAHIQITDDYTPEKYFDGRLQEPRKYGKNSPRSGETITHNGQPVFRHTQLLIGRVLPDVILKPDTQQVQKPASVDPLSNEDGDFSLEL